MTEDHIRAELDGKFFSIVIAPGIEAVPRVKEFVVPRDFIPEHRGEHKWMALPTPESYEIADKGGRPALTWSEADDLRIMNGRNAGVRWKDLARSMGRALDTVRLRYMHLCKERGIMPAPNARSNRTKITKEVRNRIIEMRSKGIPYSAIATATGISASICADVVYRHNKLRKAAA